LPVSGIITEINPLLESEPEKVNTDPYGEGWMVKLQMDNPEEVNQLMDADAYEAMVS
jgi:glycine cleavage system H protein